MFERRINSRIPSDFASKARRDFWARKQAESQADSQAESQNNLEIVRQWERTFNATRNALKTGQKNFTGIC